MNHRMLCDGKRLSLPAVNILAKGALPDYKGFSCISIRYCEYVFNRREGQVKGNV